MHILIFGLNHKVSPVEVREKLAFSAQDLPRALDTLLQQPSIEEAVILSTCNRVEIIVTSQDKNSAHKEVIQFLSEFHHLERNFFESYLYAFFDERALEHLFRVACGLDSLVFGEVEIFGQVKEAFRLATEKESIGSYLLKLYEKINEVSKRIRSQTQIGRGATSVASASVELAEKIFGQLRGEKVMVLGTGEMSSQALKYLADAGCGSIVVSSRNFDKALVLAKEFHAEAVSFETWLNFLPSVDILLCSTSAPHYLLTVDQMKTVMDRRHHKPTFLIDISVPRNIDPKINELDDVYLYNVDDLKIVCESNLKIRQAEWPKCVEVLEQGVREFYQWEKSLQLGPLVKTVSDYFDQIVEGELKRIPFESEKDREQMQRMMRRVKLKFMHQPLERLKEAASNGGFHLYLNTIHELFQNKEATSSMRSEKEHTNK